ncbi:hypothetical protein [Clostridium estertheticum]|nr:hypothetical protein [Clostridium estertheticum]
MKVSVQAFGTKAPAIIVSDKVNGVWLNSSKSDDQLGFDGTRG